MKIALLALLLAGCATTGEVWTRDQVQRIAQEAYNLGVMHGRILRDREL